MRGGSRWGSTKDKASAGGEIERPAQREAIRRALKQTAAAKEAAPAIGAKLVDAYVIGRLDDDVTRYILRRGHQLSPRS